MTMLTRDMMDDLLGTPPGPMIPPDEGAMHGRESMTLVPDGTFVTHRERVPGGEYTMRPNAYETGRVKVLTERNEERNFPREGGLTFDAERERKMSYRTRAETYRRDPYDKDLPVVGEPMWPSRRLFPYNPTIKQVVSVEHDIQPPGSVTSGEDSLVTDGSDDSRRGFSPAADLDGGFGMLYGLSEDAFNYGGPSDSESGVNEHDLLTLVAWDEQNADWQLGAKLQAKVADLASRIAHKIAKAAIAHAQGGKFKSFSDAESWMRARAKEIQVKRVRKIETAIRTATEQAIKIARPKIQAILSRKGVGDYLMDDEGVGFSDEGIGAFTWRGRGFAWGRKPLPPGQARAAVHRATEKVFRNRRGFGADFLPEYADSQDTTGWQGFEDNDKFSYLGDLGITVPSSVTQAATGAVTDAIKSGEVSTTDQIVGAISSAAKAAADIYAAKLQADAAKATAKAAALTPAVTLPPSLVKAGTVLASPDVPFWKRPLFWIGAGLLTVAGGFFVLKGGGASRRRRSRRNKYSYRRRKYAYA